MLTIYGVPISVHTRKVIIAARLKNLPFELIPVVPVMPDSLPPHWRQLSPTGMVPALQDGDFTLADSAAICAYLERKWPKPSLLPTDVRHYGHALWLEQYASGTVFRDVVRPLFHELFVHPKVRNTATDQALVGDVLDRVLPYVHVGSSLIVSDLGPSFEVGQSTDFIVQTQGVRDRIEFLQQGSRARAVRVVQVLEQFGGMATTEIDTVDPVREPLGRSAFQAGHGWCRQGRSNAAIAFSFINTVGFGSGRRRGQIQVLESGGRIGAV